MNTIQWKLESTPERIKAANLVRYLLGFAMHISGLIYALIVYFNFQSNGKIDSNFAKILLAVYVIQLLIWYLFLNNFLKFKEKIYTISDMGIEIQELKSGKVKKYSWEIIKSFSKKSNAYDKEYKIVERNDVLYVGFQTNLLRGSYITLFGIKNHEEVYGCLKKKVEEI